MKVEWMSTEPGPNTGMNAAGGWKLHAVNVDTDATYHGIGPRSAVCGVRPAHGWGCDLFITDKCVRCRLSLGQTVMFDHRLKYRPYKKTTAQT